MAIKFDYVLRETGGNLVRNFTLTIAAVLTVAVSLALFGSALYLRSGVDNMTKRWEGDVEFIIFLNADATDEQHAAVEDALEANPNVDSWRYFTQEEAYEEAKELFKDQPALLKNTTPEILPPSYRVTPAVDDARTIDRVGQQFLDDPGVLDVVFAKDAVEKVQTLSRYVNTLFLGASVVLLVSSLLLTVNTIRTAMFARRREIEVMKLVGATNWFIRVPFMLEGLFQGMVGAVTAIGWVVVLNNLFDSRVTSRESNLAILQSFSVPSSELLTINVALGVLGAIVGVVGSGIAVSRFLDV